MQPEANFLSEADGKAENQGGPETNVPVEADGNAEKQGTLQLTIQLKPMAKLKKKQPGRRWIG